LTYQGVFPIYHRTNVQEAMQNPMLKKPLRKPSIILKALLYTICHSSVFFLIVFVGVANTGLFGISQKSAVAQTPLGARTMSQVNLMFVNPSAGDDNTGNGGERTPFRTITQALRQAQPNTVIMLATGTYSEQNGEKFPLILKPGVSLQGDVRNKGRGTLIQGGGEYLSRSYGKQNITIVAVDQAGLTGVTVTNTNEQRGYAVWIESASPTLLENTFANSTQDGVMITGNSAPTINKNYFYRNKANGITIAGNSRPQVRENIFQQTGFGINITQNAEPQIVSNKIQFNRAGVVVQANARPVLRNNLIQGNREDGLVAIAQSMPDLGNDSDRGGNEFRNNVRYDINANASKQQISAFGNTIASNRIVGRVDLRGTQSPSPVAPIAQNNAPTQQNSSGREIYFSAPEAPQNINQNINQNPNQNSNQNSAFFPSGNVSINQNINPNINQAANNITTQPFNNQLMPSRPATVRTQRANLPPAQNQIGWQPNGSTGNINYARINTREIEFAAPEASSNQSQELGSRGWGAGIRPNNMPNNMPNNGVPAAEQSQMGMRYRVVVQVASQRDEEFVRFIVPGAITSVSQGRGVMQAGVFTSPQNANELVKIFNSNGLRAMVEPLN
jgi:parallel beta-helix repeat protein